MHYAVWVGRKEAIQVCVVQAMRVHVCLHLILVPVVIMDVPGWQSEHMYIYIYIYAFIYSIYIWCLYRPVTQMRSAPN